MQSILLKIVLVASKSQDFSIMYLFDILMTAISCWKQLASFTNFFKIKSGFDQVVGLLYSVVICSIFYWE